MFYTGNSIFLNKAGSENDSGRDEMPPTWCKIFSNNNKCRRDIEISQLKRGDKNKSQYPLPTFFPCFVCVGEKSSGCKTPNSAKKRGE